MAVEYQYTQDVNIARLTTEIQASTITVVLDYINAAGTDVSIFFKAALGAEDLATLDALVAAHVNSPLDDPDIPVNVAVSPFQTSQGIPFVYATPRPMGYCSYFTSEGDTPTTIGGGAKAVFNMLSTDVSKTIDLSFNEDVYLKDGLALTRNAPLGSSVDIEVVHPLYGHILYFAKASPLLGDFPSAMDTEDRAYLPAGIIVRITVHNSSGADGEDAPADFQAIGRLELYRTMLEITA